MDVLISQISRQNQALSVEQIEGILYLLANEKGIDGNRLIIKTGLPKETVRKFKHSISSFLEEKMSEELLLKSDYIERFKSCRPFKWTLLDTWENDKNALEVIERAKDFRSQYGKVAKRELDQFYATPETTYKKAKILLDIGIAGKRILFLGDDDLVSLTFAKLTSQYSEILVADIDRDLLSFIDDKSKEMNLKNVRTLYFDVRSKKKFDRVFDIVVTDPPYTRSGVAQFLNVAIDALNEQSATPQYLKYIHLYFGSSKYSEEKFLKVQEIISIANLLIENKIDNFAQYDGAYSIGANSSLYVLRTTPQTSKILNVPQLAIYTHQNQKEEKFPFVDHFVFKVYGVDEKVLKSKALLTGKLNEFCKGHKLKVVDALITDFKGGGMTVTYVLASSNLVVHTWPEMNALHMDLITCSPIISKDTLGDTVKNIFSTGSVEITKIE